MKKKLIITTVNHLHKRKRTQIITTVVGYKALPLFSQWTVNDKGEKVPKTWDAPILKRTGDSWRNCGNIGHAYTIEEAKDAIDEKIMESLPKHKVVMNCRPYYFDWLEDASKFARMFDGDLLPYGEPICNP